MAFNKAKEEYKWKQWKEAEESKMRELGVQEEIILKLREQDWEDFKKERNYNEHQFPNSDVVEISLATMCSADRENITTVKALLDEMKTKHFLIYCVRQIKRLCRSYFSGCWIFQQSKLLKKWD